MKTKLLLPLAICLATGAMAQTKYEIEGRQEFGYEHNLFRSAPQNNANSTSNGLISDPFSLTQVNIKGNRAVNRWGKLYLNSTLNTQQYLSQRKASQHRVKATLRYRHKLSKGIKMGFYATVDESRRLSRAGIVDGEVRLLSSTDLFGGGELLVRPMKQNRTRMYADLGTKLYRVKGDQTNLTYHHQSVGVVSTQKLSRDQAIRARITIQNRRYTQFEATPAISSEEETELGVRRLRYATIRTEYRQGQRGGGYIFPYAQYRNRVDVSGGNAGFHEGTLGLSAGKRFGDYGFNASASYAVRQMKTRMAGTSENPGSKKLTFQYIRLEAEPYYRLGDQWAVFSRFSMVNRLSNSTNPTSRFGSPYFNYEATAGVRYLLVGKTKRFRRK